MGRGGDYVGIVERGRDKLHMCVCVCVGVCVCVCVCV